MRGHVVNTPVASRRSFLKGIGALGALLPTSTLLAACDNQDSSAQDDAAGSEPTANGTSSMPIYSRSRQPNRIPMMTLISITLTTA